MNVIISEAAESDVPDLMLLLRQPDISPHDDMGLDEMTALFKRLQQKQNQKIYIACLDGRAVGTFTLILIEHLSHNAGKSMIMEDVVVLRESRGQGIGQLMMRDAMKRAQEVGCYKLALSSNLKRTGAHQFYEKAGFTKHGHSFVVNLEKGL
jgi:GNAT superfamily N-acetyltransferase